MATLEQLQQQLDALTQRVDAITAPPTDYYTQRWSGEETDRGVGIALGLDPEGTGILSPEHGGTGAETAQGALAKLGAGVRPNLLDNAYFIGGGIQNSLPINQIGGKPDRWRLNPGGSVEINEASIAFTNTTGQGDGYYFQLVPLSKVKLGETYTASALLLSGSSLKYVEVVCYNSESPGYQVFGGNSVNAAGISSVTFTIPTNTTRVEFRFVVGLYGTVGSMEIVGGKLEEGEKQTLAYQDSDGNWQLLPQPDSSYTAQLLECQRYQVYNSASAYFRASYVSANAIGFNIPVPNTLRTNPVFDGSPNVQPINLSGAVSGFTFAYYAYPGYVRVVATKTGHALSDATLQLPIGMFNSNL